MVTQPAFFMTPRGILDSDTHGRTRAPASRCQVGASEQLTG